MKKIIIVIAIELLAIYYLPISLLILVTILVLVAYFISNLRYSLALFPLYILTRIQGRKFNVLSDKKEITRVMQFSNKGRMIEELFATNGWHPILSMESVNSPIWEDLRDNYMALVKFFPSAEKLGFIANKEASYLLSEDIKIDGRQISISSLKIFLQWIFCENDLPLNPAIETNGQDLPQTTEKSLAFINQFLTDEFLENLYQISLEYRKHIAIKQDGNPLKKQEGIDLIVDILKKSKYKDVFEDWSLPINYSVVLQPLIISPMINMSDIAVALKKHKSEYKAENFKTFWDYVDYCIFKNHPFPLLERYEEATNTHHFIDLNYNKLQFDETFLNFGLGPRSCLGRIFAQVFLSNFFEPLFLNSNKFTPEENHLWSGRDNDDKVGIREGVYQLKTFFRLTLKEYKRSRKLRQNEKNNSSENL